MSANPVLEAMQPFIDAFADAVAARLMKGQERMIAQHQSELGSRRHREAVKRRLANGEGGAGISRDGRRFLLTPEALREELARPLPTKTKRGETPPAPPVKSRTKELNDFERELMSGLRQVASNR